MTSAKLRGGVGQGILAVGQFFSQTVTHIPGFGMAPQTAARLGSFVIETGTERWLRAYGAFGSPNILGGYLALVFVIGLLLYLKSSPPQKIFFTVGQMVVVAGLVLSFSRGAWAAVGAGAIATVILTPPLRGKNLCPNHQEDRDPSVVSLSQDDSEPRNDILKQLVFCFLVVAVLFFIFRPLFTTRFTPSVRLESRSLAERAGQYRDALSILKEHWLTGVGPGAYTAALVGKHPERPVWNLQPAHNIYLLLFVELGAVGFVLFFWWCFFIARRILERERRWFPVLLTLLVLGLFDHWLASLYIGQIAWWVIFGLGLL